MRLLFDRQFKSVTSFDPIELPDFVVITGVNGAGKSHLLEAIENGSISVEGIPQNNPHGTRPIRRFDSNTLVPQDTGPFSAAQISQEQSSFWHEISQHREQHINSFKDMLRGFGLPSLENMEVKELLAMRPIDFEGLGMPPEKALDVHQSIKNAASNADSYITSRFIQNDPVNRTKLISSLSSAAQVPLFAMGEEVFFSEFPKLWQPVDLFQQSFARLFSAYQRHWSQNKLRASGSAEGEEVSFLTEAQFIEKHGVAPWNFLNEILSIAGLDFRINEPYKWDDRPYEPILTDVKRDVRVRFNDLSSGERILMSFALCLYHANDHNSAADFPKLILFDEVDAPLHPSMTRSLLRTIQRALVDQHQIKVILTTHSPSTVALAPSESIFVMHKYGHNRLKVTNKDAALGILTSGVPTLSVKYENQRQVFVESKYDVQYYAALYEISKPLLEPELSLSFIASGPGGNANCDQVKALVHQLSSNGNKTVVGAIDWDKSNVSSSTIFVLGENERYSVENFLLDPVLLGLLLLRERMVSAENIGLSAGNRYTDASLFGQAQLQSIANTLVSKIARPKELQKSEYEFETKFDYASGLHITVPRWFSLMQGHALEQQIKTAHPQLLRYRNEPDLKLAIIHRVLDDFPQFVPLAFIRLFQRIQRAGQLEEQSMA
ncbi:AAA family ATPase [Achromobacter marplatensis]|uniref:ATP-binding protein n=1 Tax=Achromobacter marplatensis TaxID=470868 RepID=A0AA43B097_9BURK|nr:ATP-binding protein [Achromobacter marplatensis]MDH2049637.1 ATP-binding protein [Achromobacter marplatensis]